MQVLYKSTIIFAEIEKLNLKFTNYGQINVKTDKVGKMSLFNFRTHWRIIRILKYWCKNICFYVLKQDLTV